MKHYPTKPQLALLKRLPLSLDVLSGFEKRTMLALAKMGLCTASESTAIPTKAGSDLLAGKPATKRRGGVRPKPDGPAKARERDAAPTPRTEWDRLRAEIVARYEADLAALDRVREIAEAVR